MISEIYHTEQWDALVEELVKVYREDLIDQLVDAEDSEYMRVLQAKIQSIPEILHYLRERVEWGETAITPAATPKAGY